MWFCYQITHNYAFAIVIFTVIMQFIMLPLTIKQKKGSAQQTALQPEIQKLRKQYGKNQEKMAEEQQRLYAESGFKMSSSCLPLVIQLPILFGLIDVIYRPLHYIARISGDVIASGIEIANSISGVQIVAGNRYAELQLLNAVHGHADAFSAMDPSSFATIQGLNLNIFGLDLTSTPTLWQVTMLFPIVAGLLSLLQLLYVQRLNKHALPEGSPSSPGMNLMTIVMGPVFTIFIGFSFPLGLAFYWGVRSLVVLLQEFILNIVMPQKGLVEGFMEDMAEKRRQAQKSKKKKSKKVVVVDGEEKVFSDKDYESRRLSEARKEDEKKYAVAIDGDELQERIDRLNEARRRDSEKYGEPFVEATAADFLE